MTLDEKEKMALSGALGIAINTIAEASHPKMTWMDVNAILKQLGTMRDAVQKVDVVACETT